MSRFRRNLASNFIATGWAAIMQLVCVPLYTRLLGIEAYGLIGFHITLVAVLQVLDLGLSPTMNREMARLSAGASGVESARDFARTLEVCYWVLGIVLGAAIIALSQAIAVHWINLGSTSVPTVRRAIAMMGVLIALQWPLSFYQSGLRGLQHQVGMNIVRVVSVTASTGGAVLLLALWSTHVETYFLWQIFVQAIQVAALWCLLWKGLPASKTPSRFRFATLRESLDFARGMTGIALFGAILTQMDRVVISKELPLAQMGYYTLAVTMASGLMLFITPLFTAIFPRLSALVASGDATGERHTYHFGSQLMVCLVVPTAMVLVVFPADVILAWTGDAQTARICAGPLRLLAIGTALNGLMNLPYALQVAHGWTSIGLRLTIVKVLIFLPVLLMFVPAFGLEGAAASWAALNAFYLAVGVPLTHRRLLRGEAWTWMLKDVGLPSLLAAIMIVAGAALLQMLEVHWDRMVTAISLVMMAGVACGAAISAAPMVRAQMFAAVRVLAGARHS